MHYCKLCQGNTRTLIDEKKELFYYRCCTCGFLYLDDVAIITSIKEKRHYEKHNNSFECTGYVKMFDSFIKEAVSPYLNTLQTALDFGCGKGPVLAELLRQKGLEVDQYDLYFYPDKMYQNKKYDLITSTEVFEHLKEPIETLKILMNSLNTHGYIILMTQFPPKEDDDFLKWWYRRDITHISFFTPKSFDVMAEKVGLKVVKTMNDNIVIFQKS